MKILILGAGQVGTTIVEALHDEHELTIIDLDPDRLSELSYRYDVLTVEGNGASRRVLQSANAEQADLVMACTSSDESNLVSAMLAKGLSDAQTIVRVTEEEHLEAWRERQIEVDFMVSSEVETANAVSGHIGIPAARQTDHFAEGQVQIVEFDVPDDAAGGDVVGRMLREAAIPDDSKVASIIRGESAVIPRGDATIEAGDRVIIIGSPQAAREWSRIIARGEHLVDDVVIFGAGRNGVAIARNLIDQRIKVRLVEANADRARRVAEDLPKARVFHATGFEPDFLDRERIPTTGAAVFSMRQDSKNLYAATLARVHGMRFTIAVVDDPISVAVFEQAGIDVAVNPRMVTAEEMVRFAHDPRIRQLVMLEGDRFEVLDITVRPESEFIRKPFSELPIAGSLIGAIVRNGTAIFPHGSDMLEPGDRAIIFTESTRATEVERQL